MRDAVTEDQQRYGVLPMSPTVKELCAKVNERTGFTFNHAVAGAQLWKRRWSWGVGTCEVLEDRLRPGVPGCENPALVGNGLRTKH